MSKKPAYEEFEKKLSHHLEDLVQERTTELTRSNEQLRIEITGRIRMEKALRMIMEATANVTGEIFIRNLVKQFASVIGFRYTFVGELVAQEGERIRTLALWANGDNVEYELAGTPCANVVEQGFRFYPKNVQQYFPKDHLLVEMEVESYMGIPLVDSSGNTIGILVAMHDKSMEKLSFAQTILTIFAIRIVAEIERKKANEQLQKAHHKLEIKIRERTADLAEVNEKLQVEIRKQKQAEKMLQRKHQIQGILNAMLHISLKPYSLQQMLNCIIEYIDLSPWSKPELRDFSCCTIFLVEDNPDVLVLKSFRELPEYLQTQCARIPFGRCICGQAASTGKVQFANFLDARHEIQYEGIVPHSNYCVPILSSGKVKVLGVLNFYVNEGHRYNKEEEDFLLAIANVVAGIIERKRAEKSLRKRESELRIKTDNLEEINTALRVLLKKRDEDKTELEEKVLSNIKELILPYLEKLKNRGLDARYNSYLSILESNLNDIVSSFSLKLSSCPFGRHA